jgi:hypothetical protein
MALISAADHPVDVAPVDQQIPAMERSLDRLVEVGQLDRFQQVVKRTPGKRFGCRGRVVHAGQHDDGQVGIDRERLGHDFDTGHTRHPHIA